MSTLSNPIMNGALLVDRFDAGKKLLAVAFGVCLLTLSSYAEIPMYPVPMTMQTAAVLLIGALYGRKLGTATVASWLGLAMMGAPLLAGGAGGFPHFMGPTAGYLVGFLIAAFFVGWLSDMGWNGMKPLRALISMYAGSKIILGLGWVWLATLIGGSEAWVAGVAPFLVGDLAKTLFSVLVLLGVHKAYTEHFLK